MSFISSTRWESSLEDIYLFANAVGVGPAVSRQSRRIRHGVSGLSARATERQHEETGTAQWYHGVSGPLARATVNDTERPELR